MNNQQNSKPEMDKNEPDSNDNSSWQNALRSFCSVTPIHGFHFAVDSPSPLEKLFWVCCIVTCASLTVNEFWKSTVDYLNEPTVTSVHLQSDYTLRFPNVTLCVPILNSFTVTDKLSKQVRTRNHFLTSIDLFNDSEVIAFLDKYKEDRNLLQYFTYQNYSTNDDTRTLLLLTIQTLAQITSVEGMHVKSVIGESRFEVTPALIDRDFSWYSAASAATTVPAVHLSAFQRTFNLYSSLNVNMLDVLHTVANVLCDVFQIKVEVEEHGGSFINFEARTCDRLRPKLTWFSVLPFAVRSERKTDINACFNLGPIALMPNQYVEVSLSPENIYNVSQLTPDEQLKHLTSFLDLMGGITVPFYNKNALSIKIPPKTYTIMGVEIFGEFLHHGTKRAPCSKESTYLNCRGRCRAEYMLRNCGCWPLTWFAEDKPSGAKFCPAHKGNLSTHILSPEPRCHYVSREHDPDGKCREECLDSCKQRILLSFGADAQWNYSRSAVYLKGKRFHYPIFLEQLKVDWTTYLSNIGGTFGLWLGASFLGIIHIVVSIIRCLGHIRNCWFGQGTFTKRVSRQDTVCQCTCGTNNVATSEDELEKGLLMTQYPPHQLPPRIDPQKTVAQFGKNSMEKFGKNSVEKFGNNSAEERPVWLCYKLI